MSGGNFLPPHIPHPTNGTLSSSLLSNSFKIELYTLASWHRARSALIALDIFVPPSLSLFYIRSREKIPLLGSPEMSDKSRYEWRLYLHPSHILRLLTPLFSLFSYHSREKTIHPPLYPFLGTPEMSDKLRYEWQIILRYYPLIIYEVPLERPTASTCKTIHLERKTTPHLLSHWTTHLQYRRKYYAYSCTQ